MNKIIIKIYNTVSLLEQKIQSELNLKNILNMTP